MTTYTQIKAGQQVEVKGDKGFWYTVSRVRGSNVELCFGHSDNYAGTFPVSHVTPKGGRKYSSLDMLI